MVGCKPSEEDNSRADEHGSRLGIRMDRYLTEAVNRSGDSKGIVLVTYSRDDAVGQARGENCQLAAILSYSEIRRTLSVRAGCLHLFVYFPAISSIPLGTARNIERRGHRAQDIHGTPTLVPCFRVSERTGVFTLRFPRKETLRRRHRRT